MAGNRIEPMGKEVSAQLCTAQVVVSLANAVKELVENALDADATVIEVKLKAFGVEQVEVSDNGHGIKQADLDNVGKPHHTSKLRTFTGISAVDSFGFRGEALNALCALCDVELVTRTGEDDMGTLCVMDRHGHIAERKTVARQIGTTVRLQRLFHQLPVRRRELERNARREFTKVLQRVQAYALCAQHVRISCSHTGNDGKRQLLLSTPGTGQQAASIVAVLGVKQLDTLVPLSQAVALPTTGPDVAEQFGLDQQALALAGKFRISGYVSCAEVGKGRGTTDRQFIFINGRPCDYPALCKLINDVFKQYNRAQFPVVVLNVQMDKALLDRNVTPDKRRVMVAEEKLLLALVKSAVQQTWLDQNAPSIPQQQQQQPAKRARLSDAAADSSTKPQQQQRTLASFAFKPNESSRPAPLNEVTRNLFAPDDTTSARLLCKNEAADNIRCSPAPSPVVRDAEAGAVEQPTAAAAKSRVHQTIIGNMLERFGYGTSSSTAGANDQQPPPQQFAIGQPTSTMTNTAEAAGSAATLPDDLKDAAGPSSSNECTAATASDVPAAEFDFEAYSRSIPSLEQRCSGGRVVDTSGLWQQPQTSATTSTIASDGADAAAAFTGLMDAPDDSARQNELNAKLTKSCLARLRVIGQFNLGFILCSLDALHLFIVDQHAADEKYMFEMYTRNAVIQSQPLIRAKPLNMNAVGTSVIRDNLAVFRKNGFDFKFKTREDGLEQVLLVATPSLHGWLFDTNDIDDMVNFLTDFPGVQYRPAKLRRIFASKACRKSIMIGRALKHAEMEKVVQHLSTLDSPWNCPHGRPTLRYLNRISDLSTTTAAT